MKLGLMTGIYFLITPLLVPTQWRVSSFKIIRGDIDKVLYCEDDHEMVKLTDNGTMTCNVRQSCQCNWRDGYNTVIYNREANFFKCSKDEEKTVRINPDGKYRRKSHVEAYDQTIQHVRRICIHKLSRNSSRRGREDFPW